MRELMVFTVLDSVNYWLRKISPLSNRSQQASTLTRNRLPSVRPSAATIRIAYFLPYLPLFFFPPIAQQRKIKGRPVASS